MSRNCKSMSRNYIYKTNQNCEIKSRNNLFYFLISGGNGLPLLPNAHIKYNVTHQTFPQPLTKCSCKTILCLCESCHAIFRNNIFYKEIARSRKGSSYVYTLSRFMDLCAHSVFVYVGGPARCACQRCLVTVHLTR